MHPTHLHLSMHMETLHSVGKILHNDVKVMLSAASILLFYSFEILTHVVVLTCNLLFQLSSPTTGSYPERMERTSRLSTLDARWTFPRQREGATTSRSSSPAMTPPKTWPVWPCATESRGASRPTPMASLLHPSFSCTDLTWRLLRRRMGSRLPPRS